MVSYNGVSADTQFAEDSNPDLVYSENIILFLGGTQNDF